MSSAMGSATARGPTKVNGILANNGVDNKGQRLLSHTANELLSEPLIFGGIDSVSSIEFLPEDFD